MNTRIIVDEIYYFVILQKYNKKENFTVQLEMKCVLKIVAGKVSLKQSQREESKQVF